MCFCYYVCAEHVVFLIYSRVYTISFVVISLSASAAVGMKSLADLDLAEVVPFLLGFTVSSSHFHSKLSLVCIKSTTD